jgi:heptosyltransferase-3
MRNIGDVLLTSPVFANLKEYFPNAKICALVNSGTEEMLTDNPVIDKVYIYERKMKDTPFIQRLINELQFLKKLKAEQFDLVLNLTEGDRGALVALTSGAKYRVGVKSFGRGFFGKDKIFNKLVVPSSVAFHTVEQNLQLLDAAEIPVVNKVVSFHIQNKIVEDTKNRLADIGMKPGEYFHAHVTSRWMFKTMPPATAAMLLNLLSKQSGLPCLLTASPEQKELDYLTKLQQHTVANIPLFSDLQLKGVGAVSNMSRFFVGVDSAPMHIAAALNIPVLGIFGPSSAQNWGPWNNDLSSSPYNAERGIQINEKHIVLQSGMECVPCHRDGCNGSKVSDCLNFNQETLEHVVSLFLKNIRVKANA